MGEDSVYDKEWQAVKVLLPRGSVWRCGSQRRIKKTNESGVEGNTLISSLERQVFEARVPSVFGFLSLDCRWGICHQRQRYEQDEGRHCTVPGLASRSGKNVRYIKRWEYRKVLGVLCGICSEEELNRESKKQQKWRRENNNTRCVLFPDVCALSVIIVTNTTKTKATHRPSSQRWHK